MTRFKIHKSTIVLVLLIGALVVLFARTRYGIELLWAANRYFSESDKDKAARYRAVTDPAVCAKANGSVSVSLDLLEFSREYCYRNLAKNLNDPKWCTNLFVDSAFHCIEGVAVAAKDTDKCLEIMKVPSTDVVSNFKARQRYFLLSCEGAVLGGVDNSKTQEEAYALLSENQEGAFSKCKALRYKRHQDKCFALLGRRFFWGPKKEDQDRPIKGERLKEACVDKFSPGRFRMCLSSFNFYLADPKVLPALKVLLATNNEAKAVYCDQFRSSYGFVSPYDQHDKVFTPLRKELCSERPEDFWLAVDPSGGVR